MSGKYKHCHGFSLLEVLVAFLITALSMSIFFQIMARGNKAAFLGDEYAEATLIAESKLALISFENDAPPLSLYGTHKNKFNWNIVVNDYSQNKIDSVLPLKEVVVNVVWGQGRGERSLRLATLKPVLLK